MLSMLKTFGTRFALMIMGEALQSAFHFGLNLFLLRRLSAHDYGVFAIAMVIGGLSLTYVRALTGMPASIWVGQSQNRLVANGYDVMFGSAAVAISLVIAVFVIGVFQLWIGSTSISAGLFVGLWSFRSHLRTSMFARGRQRSVAVGDFIFALSGAALIGVIFSWVNSDLLQTAFLALALTNALAIFATLATAGSAVRVSFRHRTRRRYLRQWRQLGWSTISVSMANLQGQGMAILVAVIAGPTAYAPIAAALLLFVPLRLISATLVNMMQPIFAAYLAGGVTGRVWRQALAWVALSVGGGVVYGVAVTIAIPSIKTQAFQGAPVDVLIFFAWAIQIVCLLYAMPRCLLEVAKRFRLLAMINIVSAAVGLTIVTLALYVARSPWALAGALVSESMVLIACWTAVRSIVDPKLLGSSVRDDVNRPGFAASSNS